MVNLPILAMGKASLAHEAKKFRVGNARWPDFAKPATSVLSATADAPRFGLH
jgi:hypothetical protein